MNERRSTRKESRAEPPRFTLSAGWAAVILAFLVAMFFHEVFLGGKTFVSPDATQPLGFVVAGEHSLWQDHVYPLWNPFVFLGMPSFASGAYNPLIYPPDWPLALVQKVVPLPELTWLLLYYFLGGLFFFLLAREWGARAEGALLAAAGFVFAPNLVAVGSHGHGSQLVDSAYLPLLLWLSTRWMRRGGLANLGTLALAGGFQILRGHVQICFYTWLAVALATGVYLLFGPREETMKTRLLRAGGVGLAAIVAFGIAGFYSLPLKDYARWSIRGGSDGGGGVGMDYATQWSLAPYELPTLVIPGWVGFGNPTYWGGMPFTDYPNAYVGMVAVLLALPAFVRRQGIPPWLRIFALALAGFAILVAFGKNSPVYGLLYSVLPLFNKFRIPVMILLLFQVAIGLGAAWGWTAVLDAAAARPAKGAKEPAPNAGLTRLLVVGGAILVVGLLVAAAGNGLRDGYVRMAMANHQPYSPDLANAAFQLFIGDLARECVIGLMALLVLFLTLRRTLPATIGSVLMLGLLLFELMPVSGQVMAPVVGDPVARSRDAGRDDVVSFLEKAGEPGSFRILPLAETTSNRYAGFSIASIYGYHAAKPRLFQDLVDHQLVINPYWMRLLNIRYIVAPQPLEPLPPYLRQVFQGSQIVYENLFALPRVTMVDHYRVLASAPAILDSISNGTSDSAEEAFLLEDPRMPQGTMGSASASIVRYRLNDVTLETRSEGPALMRFAELWYPDWHADLDGREVPILRTDYFLRGVVVPAGTHRVTFTFRSAAMRQGLTLSIVSALLALGTIGAGVLRRRKASTPMEAA